MASLSSRLLSDSDDSLAQRIQYLTPQLYNKILEYTLTIDQGKFTPSHHMRVSNTSSRRLHLHRHHLPPTSPASSQQRDPRPLREELLLLIALPCLPVPRPAELALLALLAVPRLLDHLLPTPPIPAPACRNVGRRAALEMAVEMVCPVQELLRDARGAVGDPTHQQEYRHRRRGLD